MVKGGAEKLRLKRVAQLKSAASDPKQTKLCFVSQFSKVRNSLILLFRLFYFDLTKKNQVISMFATML